MEYKFTTPICYIMVTWYLRHMNYGDVMAWNQTFINVASITIDFSGLCYIEATLKTATNIIALKIALGVFYVAVGTFLFASITTDNVVDFATGVRMKPEVICI